MNGHILILLLLQFVIHMAGTQINKIYHTFRIMILCLHYFIGKEFIITKQNELKDGLLFLCFRIHTVFIKTKLCVGLFLLNKGLQKRPIFL